MACKSCEEKRNNNNGVIPLRQQSSALSTSAYEEAKQKIIEGTKVGSSPAGITLRTSKIIGGKIINP